MRKVEEKIGTIKGIDILRASRPRSEKISGCGVHQTKKDKARKRKGRDFERRRKEIKKFLKTYWQGKRNGL